MRLTVASLFVVSLLGCDKRVVGLPAGPTSPSTTLTPAPSGAMLSGMVFESTAEGRRPLPGSHVWLVVGNTVDSVTTDEGGRYSIANAPSPGRRRILAFPPVGLQLFQRSATTVSVNGNATVDIELVSESTRGVTYASPTLSGIVYYVAPDGRHPWPNTFVVYKAFEGPWYDVYQTSDAQGRYDFGRVPLGLGQLGAGNCNDQMQFKPIEVRGDTMADVDITSLVTTCPGIPF